MNRLIVAEVLTPREIEVCHHLANGLHDEEIAEELSIGVGTVRMHTGNIRQKLKVTRTMKAAVMLRAYGFGSVLPVVPLILPDTSSSYAYFDRKGGMRTADESPDA